MLEMNMAPCGSSNDDIQYFTINGMKGFFGSDFNVLNVTLELSPGSFSQWNPLFDDLDNQNFQTRLGDVTGDGIAEIIAWDISDVHIAELLPTGEFLTHWSTDGYQQYFKMEGLLVEDLTGDGFADAISRDLYVNQGDLTFNKADFLPKLPDQEFLPELQWRDLEADGTPELMTYRRPTDEVLVATPGVGGALPTYTFIPNPFPGMAVSYVGDLNQDGRLDRVLTGDLGLRVDYGQVGGGWSTVLETDDARGFDTEVMVFDLEGEGRLDLVITDQGPHPELASQPLSVVFMQDADGGWRSLRPASSQRTRMEGEAPKPINNVWGLPGGESQKLAHDLNQDGCDDLILLNGALSIVISRCDGTFERPVVSSYGVGKPWNFDTLSEMFELVDVNADGYDDAVVRWPLGSPFCELDGESEANAGVLLATPEGRFGAMVTFPVKVRAGFALADVDGNGRLDVITPVIEAEGEYPKPGAFCDGNESSEQVSSAVDCCSSLSGEVQVILQSMSGEWTALPPNDIVGTDLCGLPTPWAATTGSGIIGEHGSSRFLPLTIASVDMTGDGHLDLVIGADQVRASLEYTVYETEPGWEYGIFDSLYEMVGESAFVVVAGDGTGHFGPIIDVKSMTQGRLTKARTLDWDQDGDDDVMMSSGGNVFVVVNTQSPPASPAVCSLWPPVTSLQVLELGYPGLLSPANWNGDGCPDYLSPYQPVWGQGAPGIWLGNDGLPVVGTSPSIEGNWGRPCAGDFNGDGKDDLAITMSNDYITILLNTTGEVTSP
ncbi:MAG: VCBS repeat-containing protein [Myxococcales bacterium]|nr:VCBS repeat-containing protein [Myxococcales bacterium]